jgi:CRP/FNR family transcriptional regulator, cyclic AMP receptor protein
MNPKLVRQVPLFAGVGRRHHNAVAAHADEIDVPAGKVLVRGGEYAGELFVVVDGRARVRSGQTAIATVEAGDVFGEMGVLAGPTRSATVVAKTPMRLLVVGGRELSTLMHRFPQVGERVRSTATSRSDADTARGDAGA